MTSDRDAFALIDETTSVLRVRNGGFDESVLVTPASLVENYGVAPTQYRDYAALRGDPSDNLRGVPGFGSATSARLIAAFGGVDAAWTAWDSGDDRAVRDAVGDRCGEAFGAPAARAAVERNRRLMAMREDLPMPDLDTVRLPVSRAVMRHALAERGILLGPSLWALTGGSPPAGVVDVPKQWVWKRPSRRDPMPGQLTLF
jgi:DNA polymerase-1